MVAAILAAWEDGAFRTTSHTETCNPGLTQSRSGLTRHLRSFVFRPNILSSRQTKVRKRHVKPRSATPLSCGLSAEVNSILMRCFLQISLNLHPFSPLASPELMIFGMPSSLTSVNHCSSASEASSVLRRKYNQVVRDMSSRKLIAYWFPP